MLSFQRFSGFIGAVFFLIVPLISSTAVEVINPSRSPTLPGGWTPFFSSTNVPPTFTNLYQAQLHCQLQHQL
jgi:hypothetical protein